MTGILTNRYPLSRIVFVVLASTAMTLASVTGTTLAATPNKKHLSLTTISFLATNENGALPLWVAIKQGFFKQQGVDVSFLYAGQLTASSNTAVLLSGAAQFDVDAAPSQVLAAQEGAPIRGLVQANLGSPQEIAVSQSFAASNGIPLTGETTASALAQFKALKGSHITLAVSNTSSTGYSWITSLAKRYGLTSGLGCTTCDIDFVSVGSVGNETSALASGKVVAFSNTPPTTVIANTIVINLSRLPPATGAAGQYMSTLTPMITEHPDTTQAVVTGYLEGMAFLVTHEALAQRDDDAVWATIGITSPEEQTYLFADCLPFLYNPFPTKTAYTAGLALINDAQPSPITLPYSGFIITRFIDHAAQLLRVDLSKRL